MHALKVPRRVKPRPYVRIVNRKLMPFLIRPNIRTKDKDLTNIHLVL